MYLVIEQSYKKQFIELLDNLKKDGKKLIKTNQNDDSINKKRRRNRAFLGKINT